MKRFFLGMAAAALALAAAPPALAKDYLLTTGKPDKLFVIDLAARKVERSFTIPTAAPGVLTLVPSPDGKVAYMIVNHWGSISGIDLDSGKEVFRADMSLPKVRVKGMFGMDVSRDGKELYVVQSAVKLGDAEYEVQDSRIAVYNTADGLGAKPARMLEVPRRIAVLAFSQDGQTLWALGWDLYALDPKTGRIKSQHKVLNWTRKNYAPPDILDVWPQFEQAGVFSTPYFAARTDKDPAKDPDAFKTGLLTLDLKTGKVEMDDFENTAVVIFSSVVSPTKPNEVFGVYTQLSKIDRAKDSLIKRVDLPHTYYTINISSDGKELYTGGTMCDIAVLSSETLDLLAQIELPGCPDQALTSVRIIKR